MQLSQQNEGRNEAAVCTHSCEERLCEPRAKGQFPGSNSVGRLCNSWDPGGEGEGGLECHKLNRSLSVRLSSQTTLELCHLKGNKHLVPRMARKQRRQIHRKSGSLPRRKKWNGPRSVAFEVRNMSTPLAVQPLCVIISTRTRGLRQTGPPLLRGRIPAVSRAL